MRVGATGVPGKGDPEERGQDAECTSSSRNQGYIRRFKLIKRFRGLNRSKIDNLKALH